MAESTMRVRKKEATKANILKAAIELMEDNGFNDTTMQAIAAKADVALRTLYNYFPTKESIVAAYIRMTVEEETDKSWNQMLELDSTLERLLLICEKFAEWSRQNYLLTEVYASDPRNYCYPISEDIPRSGLDELLAKVLAMGQQMGDIARGIPAEVLAGNFMGLIYINVLIWLRDPEQELLAMLRASLEIFYNGAKFKGIEPAAIMHDIFC